VVEVLTVEALDRTLTYSPSVTTLYFSMLSTKDDGDAPPPLPMK